MSASPTPPEPRVSVILGVSVLSVALMSALMLPLGAAPEMVQGVAMQVITLVIGYLASIRGQGPELRA